VAVRVGGGTTTLSNRSSFNTITTISEDILTSTLIITGATDINAPGTSLCKLCQLHMIYNKRVSKRRKISLHKQGAIPVTSSSDVHWNFHSYHYPFLHIAGFLQCILVYSAYYLSQN